MLKKLLVAIVAVFAVSMAFVAPAYALTGQLVYLYNNPVNLTTSATTNLKNAAGVVHGFCVNTVGTTSTLTLYDSLTATGKKIGTWTTVVQGCFNLDANFTIGLTAVTGGTAGDITVFYR